MTGRVFAYSGFSVISKSFNASQVLLACVVLKEEKITLRNLDSFMRTMSLLNQNFILGNQ